MQGPDMNLSRRELLRGCASGLGTLACASFLEGRASGAQGVVDPRIHHHAPRARSVIFLYMDGGPSQVDTFDPKPRLERENGEPIGMKIPNTQFDNVGTVLRSPWKFKQYGESGIPVSELFPHVAERVDDLTIVRSMVSQFSEHTQANYFLHTGFSQQGRPSMGAWTTYGLGSECRDLPGFVALNGGLIPVGGIDNFGSGFLPASFQGSVFQPGSTPLPNLAAPAGERPGAGDAKRLLLERLDRRRFESAGANDAVESAVANYELARRMQAAVPELMRLDRESALTRRLYGLDASYEHTRTFGTMCLVARRLVERGVRFIELTCPDNEHDRWDQHGGLKQGHEDNARAVDQPIAGLLTDLASRGLLDETLVVWGGEFGRTPMAQGTDGRDHNPYGFTIWMAGGGVKRGHIHGATDEYGYFAIENKVTIHDLHATMLHLLGVDHKRLTYRFSGRDMRLTDVHGEVVHGVLA
jgi:hypothetical protein